METQQTLTPEKQELVWFRYPDKKPPATGFYMVALSLKAVSEEGAALNEDGNPVRTDVFSLLYHHKEDSWFTALVDAPFDKRQVAYWSYVPLHPEKIYINEQHQYVRP